MANMGQGAYNGRAVKPWQRKGQIIVFWTLGAFVAVPAYFNLVQNHYNPLGGDTPIFLFVAALFFYAPWFEMKYFFRMMACIFFGFAVYGAVDPSIGMPIYAYVILLSVGALSWFLSDFETFLSPSSSKIIGRRNWRLIYFSAIIGFVLIEAFISRMK
jgi:hypothetical protein